MSTENSWPRVRALMDRALDSERGIAVTYPSFSAAERVRASAYKIREMQRTVARKTYPDPSDPAHGISAYDGLVFWIRSTIPRSALRVTFHSPPVIAEALSSHYEQAEDGTFIPLDQPDGKAAEKEKIFPGQCCTVSLTLKEEGKEYLVEFAPTFHHAWRLIRENLPTKLYIESGYTLSGLDIEEL